MVSAALKKSFSPIVDAGVRLLVLGSLPGEVSLARQQYYAHPTNHFWRLMEAVIGADLLHLPYEQRLRALLDHRVGLWDVIREARRSGSLDVNIRDHAPNALRDLVAGLPELKAVAFNGLTSSAIGRKRLGLDTGLKLMTLPSSSAAYTKPFGDKLAEWMALKAFL